MIISRNTAAVQLVLLICASVSADQLRLTEKSLHSYNAAVEISKKRGNPTTGTAHLAKAIFSEEGSFGQKLLLKAVGRSTKESKKKASAVVAALSRQIRTLPVQKPLPKDIGQTNSLKSVLRNADNERIERGDEFVALDHLIVAVISKC